MADWPDVERLARWINIAVPTPSESATLTEIVAAVPEAIRQYCDRAFDDIEDLDDVPEPVAEAALLFEGRLWQRRNSLDGTVGFGDAGVVTVARSDGDVMRLLAPYRRIPVA
jgi:hypothetical protein